VHKRVLVENVLGTEVVAELVQQNAGRLVLRRA